MVNKELEETLEKSVFIIWLVRRYQGVSCSSEEKLYYRGIMK